MTTLILMALAGPTLLFDGDVLYDYRLVYVRAKVNKRAEGLFLLDTGANRSALDSNFAKSNGVEPEEATEVEGTAGIVKVSAATLDSVSIGGAVSEHFKVTMQDLSGFLKPGGNKVDGILGSDFLNGRTAVLDFGKRRMQIWSGAKAIVGSTVRMSLDNGIPKIEGLLNGEPCQLRIDTGAGLFESKDVYVNVPQTIFDKLGLKAERYFSASGTGGELRLPVAQAESLRIGSIAFPKPFVIGQPKIGYFSRPDAVGFVGNNLLEKGSPVALNYRAGCIVLSPMRSD